MNTRATQTDEAVSDKRVFAETLLKIRDALAPSHPAISLTVADQAQAVRLFRAKNLACQKKSTGWSSRLPSILLRILVQ
jgi:hypothetical protein